MKKCIHMEIIYEGDHCPSSFYMAEAVQEVIGTYDDFIECTKLEFKRNKEHSARFRELSVSLYGDDAVRVNMQLAPVPSLFINGELVFDVIPIRDDLIEAIEGFLSRCGISSR
ncbi:MAG: hypothetical protein ABSH41_06080 [Syntrophobacteraceae bacterium]